jgi:hypothetical protein
MLFIVKEPFPPSLPLFTTKPPSGRWQCAADQLALPTQRLCIEEPRGLGHEAHQAPAVEGDGEEGAQRDEQHARGAVRRRVSGRPALQQVHGVLSSF